RTASAGLLDSGIGLILDNWEAANDAGLDFKSVDRVVPHQVSMVYTRNFSKITGVEMERIQVSFPDWGTIAAEAVPMTLANVQDELKPGERVLLMGVGSVLITALMEVQWRPRAAPDAAELPHSVLPGGRPLNSGSPAPSRCATTPASGAVGTCWTPGRGSPSAASPRAAPCWPSTATPPTPSSIARSCARTSPGA